MKENTRNISSAIVTGPTGAIGRALCLELAQSGIKVFAVCRPGSGRISAVPKHTQIKTIHCDMSQLHKLPQLVGEKVDAFFHFAWANTIGSGRNDMFSQIQNIQYSIDAVQAAAQLGCSVFLGAGSQAEYGRVDGVLTPHTPCFPENGYGMAKLCAGHMTRVECEKMKIDHIWMRILSVYGPGDGKSTMISSVICKLLNREKPALTEGKQRWDYLYSSDAARAFRLAALYGTAGSIYVLGSGQAKPLCNYIEVIKDMIDPNLPLGFGEIPYNSLQVMHLEADISALYKDTGFVPQCSFQQGIEKTIDYFRGAKQ